MPEATRSFIHDAFFMGGAALRSRRAWIILHPPVYRAAAGKKEKDNLPYPLDSNSLFHRRTRVAPAAELTARLPV
jgi:hypothetical protein